MLQFHFALLLECIFVEAVLEVFEAENAVNGEIDNLIIAQEVFYTSRIIFSLPAQKPLAAQSLLLTGHVHTIAASARSLHITDF